MPFTQVEREGLRRSFESGHDITAIESMRWFRMVLSRTPPILDSTLWTTKIQGTGMDILLSQNGHTPNPRKWERSIVDRPELTSSG